MGLVDESYIKMPRKSLAEKASDWWDDRKMDWYSLDWGELRVGIPACLWIMFPVIMLILWACGVI